jgi:hypothetical protein
VLRINPSFHPARALSVLRRQSGAYMIRSSRLKTDVWAQMMEEMRTLQGPSIAVDDASQAAALAHVCDMSRSTETSNRQAPLQNARSRPAHP